MNTNKKPLIDIKEKPYSKHQKFKVAFKGIFHIFNHESSFRYQVIALCFAFILGLIVKLNLNEWVMIVIVSTIVLVSEAFNTAIESMLDMISPEYNKVVGQIKDICAGAVLLSALGALVIGIMIFYPKLVLLF